MNIPICQDPNFLNALFIIMTLIKIIKIVVPIILIISIMWELTNSLLKKEEQINILPKNITTKIILAIIIYLIPTITISSLELINADTSKTAECLTNASSRETINYYKEIYNSLKQQKYEYNLNNYEEALKAAQEQASKEGVNLNSFIEGESDAQLVMMISTWEGTTAGCTTPEGNAGYRAVDIKDGVITVGAGITHYFIPGLTVGQCYDKQMLDNLKYEILFNNFKTQVIDCAKKYNLDLENYQLNALTDLGYNAGTGTACKAIKTYAEEGEKPFVKYVKGIVYAANGNTSYKCALAKRRDQELELFFTGVYSNDFYSRTKMRYYTSEDTFVLGCGFTFAR